MSKILINKPSNKTREKIKLEIKDWTGTMTMHGIPNIIRTEYISLKIVWLLAFLCSSALCCYLVVQSIQNYLQFDVTTKFRIIEKDSVTFPTVTVCNANPFTTNESLNFVRDILEKNGIHDFTNSTNLSFLLDSTNNILFSTYQLGKFLPAMNLNNPSLDKQIKLSFGNTLEDLIISCTFAAIDCNMTEWIWRYDMLYGNCFVFNSGYDSNGNKIPLKSIILTGKINGFSLELFVKTPEDRNTFSTYTGAHIFIHNDSFYPNSYEGIDIASGSVTNLHLERSVREQLPRPYSECVDGLDSIDSFSSSLYKEFFKNNLTYNQKDCFSLYIQKNIIDECQCFDPSTSILNLGYNKSCLTSIEYNCSNYVYFYLMANNFKSGLKDICPLECNQVEYKIYQSFGNFPSKAYANDLIKSEKITKLFNKQSSDINMDDLRESLLSLNLFYDNLKETEITEAASITIDVLISGIGGTLGLFLGVSVLSLFEFIEIFIKLVFIKIDSK